MKPMFFKDIKEGTAFTPIPGAIGASQVFIKHENGICPIVDRENHPDSTIEAYGRWLLESIFFPYDKVYASYLPEKILKRYDSAGRF